MWLQKADACDAALIWLGSRDERQAWDECRRGDWLLWWAVRRKVDRKLLVAAACGCARLALPYVKGGEWRPLRAIEAAEAWYRGEATLEQVRAAADDAYTAASYAAASAYAANYAAYVGAHVDYAAYAGVAVVVCTYVAVAGDYAAAKSADADTMREKVQLRCADIVRRTIDFDCVRVHG